MPRRMLPLLLAAALLLSAQVSRADTPSAPIIGVTYYVTGQTSVDAGLLSAPFLAVWLDPYSGQATTDDEYPSDSHLITNTGVLTFTVPLSNTAGQDDWILQLGVPLSTGASATPTDTPTATYTDSPTATDTPTAPDTDTSTATSTATATPTSSPTPTNTTIPTATSTATPAPAAPAFVQEADVRATSGTALADPLTASVASVHTILVYVICDAGQTVSLTDNRGDIYAPVLAAQPWGSGRKAQAFLASALGGSTTISASFSADLGGHSALIYGMEYTAAVVDASAQATGSGSAMSSGAVSTTQANDRLVGLGVSDNAVTAAGAGYTARSTFHGNLTEDRATSVAGAYAATASQNGANWAMQIVALRP